MLKVIKNILLIVVIGFGPMARLNAVEVQRFQRQPNWGALHMDGKLGDPFWQKVKSPLSTFHVFQEKGQTTDDTRVKIAFDDKWLYFGFECTNMERGYDRNTCQERDGAVSGDDSVEIFISADPDRKSYYHFMLNCDNVKAEQKVIGKGNAGQRDRSWNPTWLSTAAKNNHGWTAEIAIPLEILSENGKVGALSFNIGRTKLIPEFDSLAVRIGEKRQSSTLYPVKNSFHEPESFSSLSGLETVKVQESCHLKLDGSDVESFYVNGGKMFYDVFVKYSYGGKDKDCAEITVVDKPEQSAPVEVTVPGKWVIPGRQENVKLSVPVADLAARTAVVILKEHFTKGVVEQAALSNLDKLTPLDAYFSRNYYTSENYAELACRVAQPPESLQGAWIILKDGASNELFRTEAIRAENLFRVDLAKVPLGENSLTMKLVGKEGKALFHKALTLVKRTPKPGYEWKIDQLSGVLLNNEIPFFPFGVFLYYSDELLKDMKNIGFNMFIKWGKCPSDEVFAKAAAYDLYVQDRLETYSERRDISSTLSKYLAGEDFMKVDKEYGSETGLQSALTGYAVFKKLKRNQRNEIFGSYYQANLPGVIAGIKAAAQHKNLMGYNTIDEPMFGAIDLFVQGRDLYKKTNEADGYRPTMVLYSSHIPPGTEATDWCDILCTDPYWIPDGGLSYGRGTVNFVSKTVYTTKKRADAARKMTWIVPLGSYWSSTHRRPPSAAEQMCQSYLCIIHGAKGLTYYGIPEHELLRDAIKTFGQQLKVLTPALLAPAIKQDITYSPVEFKPEKDLFPDIQTALFQDPEGGAILLAANTKERQVKVSYTLTCLPEKGEIKRLFAPGTYKVSGGTFEDSIEAFGVRAYKIAFDGKLSAPIKILVKSAIDDAYPPPTTRSATVGRAGREGKRNVVPNPSFEEATIPDLPDYFRPVAKTLVGKGAADHMRLVETEPYDGKVCLQLVNREEPGRIKYGETFLNYVGIQFMCAPQNPQPEKYTLSLYMKGSRDGVEVLFGSHGMKEWDGSKWIATWKTVKISREWQRYSVTGPIPANVSELKFELQVRGYGTVWLDAVQLEKGDKPTDFEN